MRLLMFILYCVVALEFIYCGTILKNDKQSLAEHGIKEGSTIHVFPKQEEEVHFEEPINEDQIQRAVVSYRMIMKDISGSSLAVSELKTMCFC